MTVDRRRVTLTKAQCDSPTGRELITLLTELSADGNVSREETDRLRAWLEVDHGVEIPALPFLYEVIDQISSDGEVSEEELDCLALAIERVLPKEVRAAVALQRKQARALRRLADRELRREELSAARTERRAAREAARVKAGPLFDADSLFEAPSEIRNAAKRVSSSSRAMPSPWSESQTTLTIRTPSSCSTTPTASWDTSRGMRREPSLA